MPNFKPNEACRTKYVFVNCRVLERIISQNPILEQILKSSRKVKNKNYN